MAWYKECKKDLGKAAAQLRPATLTNYIGMRILEVPALFLPSHNTPSKIMCLSTIFMDDNETGKPIHLRYLKNALSSWPGSTI